MAIGIAAIIGLAMPPLFIGAISGCETGTARISNRSGNTILATLRLNDNIVLWRDKIDVDRIVEPIYRTAGEGQIKLHVEMLGRNFEAGGSFIDGGNEHLDAFVVEPTRIVNVTVPRTVYEEVDWFGHCVLQAGRDLLGISDPHRSDRTRTKP